jgi:hypothetical protein
MLGACASRTDPNRDITVPLAAIAILVATITITTGADLQVNLGHLEIFAIGRHGHDQ